MSRNTLREYTVTVAPGVTCGQGLYGTDDGLRKAISAPVVAPLLGCI